MGFTVRIEGRAAATSLVEPGEYWFHITAAEDQVAKSGNMMVVFTASLHKDRNQAPVGAVQDRLVNAEGAMFRCEAFIATLAKMQGLTLAHGQEYPIDAAQMVGDSGYCRIGHEEYDGKKKNVIEEYLLPPEEPAVAQAPADDLPFEAPPLLHRADTAFVAPSPAIPVTPAPPITPAVSPPAIAPPAPPTVTSTPPPPAAKQFEWGQMPPPEDDLPPRSG